MSKITVYMPQTAADVYARAADIDLLTSADPSKEADIVDYLAEFPHTLYLFYLDGAPMAMIRLDDRALDPDLGRNTVEIHGGLLPQYRGMADEPSRFVMDAAFRVKKNIIAKIDPANLGAVGWVRKWGFKKINKERGRDVYRLKRSEYRRREHVIREEGEGTAPR